MQIVIARISAWKTVYCIPRLAIMLVLDEALYTPYPRFLPIRDPSVYQVMVLMVLPGMLFSFLLSISKVH